ncbi:MAG: tetratricopeptide repeat protein [Chlorobi bacterium]|nr:tetratricopeptide repeat protein [Chlorobiota bacterium]
MIHVRKHFRRAVRLFSVLLLLAGLAVYSSCSEPVSKEISDLQQLAWKNSGDAEAWFRLGNAYARNQQYRNAQDAYREALEVDPGLDKALQALGATYFNQRDYPEALVYFTRYQKLAPDDSLRNYDLGNVFLQMQQYDRAIAAYRTAIVNSISFEEAYYNLGVCYLRTGRTAEAEEIYEFLVRKNNYLAVSLKNHFNRKEARKP